VPNSKSVYSEVSADTDNYYLEVMIHIMKGATNVMLGRRLGMIAVLLMTILGLYNQARVASSKNTLSSVSVNARQKVDNDQVNISIAAAKFNPSSEKKNRAKRKRTTSYRNAPFGMKLENGHHVPPMFMIY